MVHICNDCKYNTDCKSFLKDNSGMLCSNKYHQQEIEKQWASYYKEQKR